MRTFCSLIFLKFILFNRSMHKPSLLFGGRNQTVPLSKHAHGAFGFVVVFFVCVPIKYAFINIECFKH